MKGNNELHLNEATIIEAIQMWLGAKMPNGTPAVTGVTQKDRVFVVRLSSEDTV